jgi:hypothetical protein
MATLLNKLVGKTRCYRDVAPVFRIEHRSLDEMEVNAVRLAGDVVGDAGDGKSQVVRKQARSDILLSEGVRARVFHASGAVSVTTGLAPMEQLIGEHADREAMTGSTVEAAKRLRLDRMVGAGEQLLFERLWQIKAAGMNAEGVRGREIVCRAVGAFRRYLHELPVLGRASVFVEVAGNDSIGGVGIDWRPIAPEPFDRVKVIDPERAARAVLGDLNGRLPGGEFTDEDFEVGMFSLGYVSMPKRREQSVFAPVYVAMLERRGWGSTNYVIVVNGSEIAYESLCRTPTLPPRDAVKPQPGTKPRRDAPGWDPLAKRQGCCH